jgi:hypothetical protein
MIYEMTLLFSLTTVAWISIVQVRRTKVGDNDQRDWKDDVGSSLSSSSSSSSSPLDPQYIDEFIRNGVVVIPRVLDPSIVCSIRAKFHKSLRDKGCDVLDIHNTAKESLAMLSSTGGAGGILDIFYEDWKLHVNAMPSIVRPIQCLWKATYSQCTGIWKTPFGAFNRSRGYMYIDRVCFRLPDMIVASISKGTKKKLQRSLTPHLDCCPHRMFESDKEVGTYYTRLFFTAECPTPFP